MRVSQAAAWICSVGAACLSTGVASGAEVYPNRLNAEVLRVMHSPETRERLFHTGMEVVGSTPQELGAALKSEMARMGKVIKAVGIREE